jgi:hypothetical protein
MQGRDYIIRKRSILNFVVCIGIIIVLKKVKFYLVTKLRMLTLKPLHASSDLTHLPYMCMYTYWKKYTHIHIIGLRTTVAKKAVGIWNHIFHNSEVTNWEYRSLKNYHRTETPYDRERKWKHKCCVCYNKHLIKEIKQKSIWILLENN